MREKIMIKEKSLILLFSSLLFISCSAVINAGCAIYNEAEESAYKACILSLKDDLMTVVRNDETVGSGTDKSASTARTVACEPNTFSPVSNQCWKASFADGCTIKLSLKCINETKTDGISAAKSIGSRIRRNLVINYLHRA